jgi:hypothetical protein
MLHFNRQREAIAKLRYNLDVWVSLFHKNLMSSSSETFSPKLANKVKFIAVSYHVSIVPDKPVRIVSNRQQAGAQRVALTF